MKLFLGRLVLLFLLLAKNAFCFDFIMSSRCFCPFKLNPICGTSDENGQATYMNQCLFECSRKRDPKLTKLYEGTCCSRKTCTAFDNPVCDTHGELHANYCSFEKQKCLANRIDGYNLDIDMSVPNCSCVQHCTESVKPVCDNFGRTHVNICVLSNAKCVAKARNEKVPELEHLGRCCSDLCSPGEQKFPVCDSMGNTHSDFCAFLVFDAKPSDNRPPTFIHSSGRLVSVITEEFILIVRLLLNKRIY